MGRCGACISTVTRVSLYIVMFLCSLATLYCMLTVQSKFSQCWLGGGSKCMLFGSMSSNQTRCGTHSLSIPTSGGRDSCDYVVFYTGSQTLVIVGLFCLTIVIARGRRDGHNEASWRRFIKFIEVIVVILLVMSSFTSAIMLSIGFRVFCNDMVKNWRSEPSDVVFGNRTIPPDRHLSCSKTYTFQNIEVLRNETSGQFYSVYDKVHFHNYYHIAQITAWTCFLAWVAHLIMSIVSFRRRPNAVESGLPHSLRPSDSVDSLDDNLLT